MKIALITISGFALFIGLLWGLTLPIAMIGCHNAWKSSGMDYEYRSFGGCMIEVSEGKWIQENRFRAVE